MRIKLCRKEAKESAYWLSLIDTGDQENIEENRRVYQQEAYELMKIFGSILRKSA